jgi:hypothetical protein
MALSAPVPDDIDGEALARLALLRTMHLQTAVHRAVALRQREAASTLARTSVECCITGLYCLYKDAPEAQISGEAGRSIKHLVGPLATAVLGADAMGQVSAEFERIKFPPVNQMAEVIETAGGPAVSQLVVGYYNPLSSLYLHASPLALFRNVNRRHSDRPVVNAWVPWGRRSPGHLADTAMALLAREFLSTADPRRPVMDAYASRHYGRALPPGITMMLGLVIRQVLWRRVPEAVRKTYALRHLMKSATAEGPNVERLVDATLSAWNDVLGGSMPELVVEPARRQLIDDLLARNSSGPAETGKASSDTSAD